MQDLPDIDADLWKMISVAVETSVQSIQKQGKLLPFTLMRENEKWDMAMYMGEQAPKLVQKAQAAIRAKIGKIDMYVLAFDGYVTIDGKKGDAVVIEAGEEGKPYAYMFAQRYRPPDAGKALEKQGNLAYLGYTQHYLQRSTGQVNDA
jgi:hypothetical protein